ncbi:MAG: ParA family protein [Anaerolineales bacterium]|nr:ParA family protein [Anaerolineales bacterium]MCA9930264.1 ParA family protein [Anaerolineales bacterium]
MGKTTTAVNLAAALSLTKRRVLLVDTDSQGQAAPALGIESDTGLADFMLGNVSFETAVTPARDNLDLLPGGFAIAGVKQNLGKDVLQDARRELSDKLTAYIGAYDYVIVDTAPSWDLFAVNVLFFAHELIVPVLMETASLNGLRFFLERVETIKQQGHDLKLPYLLPTAIDRRVKQTHEILPQLQQHFDGSVCEPIRYNVRLSESFGHGQHIFEYDPASNGANDYAELAKRVISDE